MIKATRAQLPKVVGVMMVVDMNPMSLHAIGNSSTIVILNWSREKCVAKVSWN